MDRVVVSPETGCWIYTGSDSGEEGRGKGYAKLKRKGVWYYLHRVVHVTFKGPIPAGYQVDHLCARWVAEELRVLVRRCCNPDHLEAVPAATNQKRKFIA